MQSKENFGASVGISYKLLNYTFRKVQFIKLILAVNYMLKIFKQPLISNIIIRKFCEILHSMDQSPTNSNAKSKWGIKHLLTLMFPSNIACASDSQTMHLWSCREYPRGWSRTNLLCRSCICLFRDDKWNEDNSVTVSGPNCWMWRLCLLNFAPVFTSTRL